MEVAAATEELSVEEVSEVAEVAAKQEETEAVAEVETSPETEAAPEEEAATEEAAEEVTIQFCQTQLGKYSAFASAKYLSTFCSLHSNSTPLECKWKTEASGKSKYHFRERTTSKSNLRNVTKVFFKGTRRGHNLTNLTMFVFFKGASGGGSRRGLQCRGRGRGSCRGGGELAAVIQLNLKQIFIRTQNIGINLSNRTTHAQWEETIN